MSDERKKKVLLTGGAGGLGAVFTPRFAAAGLSVRMFDLPTPVNVKTFRSVPPGVELFWGDIADAASVREAVRGMDEVFHLAGIVPPLTETNRGLCMKVNVEGTRNILAAAEEESRETGRPLPVRFSSSATVHGITVNKQPPVSANHPLSATSNYTESKIAAEKLVKGYSGPWTVYRFTATLYLIIRKGDFSRMKMIPADTRVEAAHLYDVCDALINSVGNPAADNKTFILGGGESCRMLYRDQIKKMFDMFGFPEPDWKKFSTEPFALDWYDTAEAQAVLNYQSRSFDDYVDDFRRALGWKYYAIRYLAAPPMRLLRIRL